MKPNFPEQDPKARVLLVLEDICPECGAELDTGWECSNSDCRYDALGKEIPRSYGLYEK